MTFTQAIASGFRRYFDFTTRSSRSEYWWWTLFSILASAVATVFDELLFDGAAILDALNTIVLFIPGVTVAVRRLHDTDRSGWWFLIAFTIIGILLLIYWYVQPGTTGSNRYGYDPLGLIPVTNIDETGHIYSTSNQTRFCPNCGITLEATDNFCHSCGISI